MHKFSTFLASPFLTNHTIISPNVLMRKKGIQRERDRERGTWESEAE
jgi:hypothetical protein